MSMFDRVDNVPDMPCPDCGKVISEHGDWQTKDGPCTLCRIDFRELDNFYTNCPHCNAWIDLRATKHAPEVRGLEHYYDVERDALAQTQRTWLIENYTNNLIEALDTETLYAVALEYLQENARRMSDEDLVEEAKIYGVELEDMEVK